MSMHGKENGGRENWIAPREACEKTGASDQGAGDGHAAHLAAGEVGRMAALQVACYTHFMVALAAKDVLGLHMPLRIIFWREGRRWWAQCLEIDALGDGATKGSALRQLAKSIATTVDFCFAHGSIDSLFQPAAPEAFRMFAQGKDVAGAELRLSVEHLDVERPAFRQYEPSSMRASPRHA